MENNKPIDTGPKKFPIFPIILVVFLAIVLIITFAGNGNNKKEIDQSEFFTMIESGEVAGVYFYGTTVYGITVGDAETSTEDKLKNFPKQYDFYLNAAYTFQLENMQIAIDDYNTAHPDAKIYYDTGIVQESILSQLLPWLYIIMIIVLGYFVYKSVTKMTGKNMDFGKNKARMEAGLKVRFSDVAGCDEEKQEMKEIVEFLKNPRKFTELGARIPKGVLLVGPPGTGKTLLAKAIAGEAGVPFFSITGSDFVEMYVGVGAARVRDLFETAKRNMPCLVFIDEIDAVGRQRGAGLGNTNDEREQTLNQLLVQMDGFESSDGIVVIAATNRPDVLDPALLRAGRFDRRIVVNKPDLNGRIKILKLYAKNKPFADDIDWEGLARRLPGSTGADIENILNEAAILAARDGRSLITQTDIFESTLKTQYGLSKKNAKVDEEDRRSTAYHEAGHAILMRVLKSVKVEVQEVTIVPRGIGGGMSGGMTSRIPEKEYPYYTREQLMEEIISLMGGRAAEKIKFGYFSTGASNDIQVATDIARDMVAKYGMSERLGSVCYAEEGEVFLGRDFQQRSNISDATARLIDEEIKLILDEGLERAIELLKQHDSILEEMAKVLLARETIYSQEVDALIEGKAADVVMEEMDERERVRKQKDKEALERKEAEKAAKAAEAQKVNIDLESTVMNAYKGEVSPKTTQEKPQKEVEQETANTEPKEENKSESKNDNDETQKPA
ncbi:MAG: ATP-dependent zinc metalloprotease FtsH [Clostridia bacterium]|nr:ATP-dependent zinc metalloprotease FtsH [Clostridia bacterium]